MHIQINHKFPNNSLEVEVEYYQGRIGLGGQTHEFRPQVPHLFSVLSSGSFVLSPIKREKLYFLKLLGLNKIM